MKILAIETSCDETSIAIIDTKKNKTKTGFKILSNELATQIELHKQYGGVFPMMAKREHGKNIVPILIENLKKAKILTIAKKETKEWKSAKNQKKIAEILSRENELIEIFNKVMPFIKKPKIDLIAVTSGPGLEPALWVGISFAKALSTLWGIPLIPINHMEGHIFSVFPTKEKTFTIDAKSQLFPMLSLLVSGGHTEIVLMKDWMKYKKIGQTRDDAVGEAFDKVARMLGLPYPGGPEISKLAEQERKQIDSGSLAQTVEASRDISQQGNIRADGINLLSEKEKINLPRPMIYSKDYDFSFSGLKTAVLYLIRDLPKDSLDEDMKRKIAKEFEDSAIEVLVHKTSKAIKEYKIKTLIIGGGVSANQHLRNTLTDSVQKIDKKIKIHFPIKSLSTDNALMIAISAYFQYNKKKPSKNISKIRAQGNLSL